MKKIRDFKFRMWDAKSKCMMDWNCIMQYAWNASNKSLIYAIFEQKFEHWILMQWIGLWDKNKKDIYEGDIVIFDNSEIGGERVTGIVVFNDDQTLGPLAWGLWTKRGYMNTDFLGHIEVIGNEYENKDLWESIE